jgi:hypothetical protein
MTKSQIAQATHDYFCDLCEKESLSEEEFIAALVETANWFNHEKREWV